MSTLWHAQENHGQWYVFRQDGDELRVRLHVDSIGIRTPLDEPAEVARVVAAALNASAS